MTMSTKKTTLTILTMGLGLLVATVAMARPKASRTVTESFRFEGAPAGWHLVVDNVHGSIRVTATDGDTVRLVAHETIVADSPADLEEARAEEHLALTVRGGKVEAIVDEAWRDERDQTRHWRSRDDRHYTVTYDFEVEVPSVAAITLKTVNDGDIEARGVEGDFQLANVNGDVTLVGTRGSGRAASVNGEVDIRFAENPTDDCTFSSVNGELDVAFQSGLAAEARFKTLNGKIYSDFPYEHMSLAEPVGSRQDGRFVLRRKGEVAIRIAGGGPELAFATVNGDIILRHDD